VRGIKIAEVGDDTRVRRRTGKTLLRSKPLQGRRENREEENGKRYRKGSKWKGWKKVVFKMMNESST
jgi:hypothetical protein